MLIEQLEEFCTLARLLNYTKAAAELHVSQSSLSRHIKQMEAELGFPLVSNRSNQLFITREGMRFLDGAIALVDEYQRIVAACRSMHDAKVQELHIHEPPFRDNAGMIFLKLMSAFRAEHADAYVSYQEVRNDYLAEFAEGTLEVALEYRYADLDVMLPEYREVGLSFAHICDTALVVACPTGSDIAARGHARLDDLRDLSIMSIYDSFSPTRKAVGEMFEAHGMTPRFTNVVASHMLDFYSAQLPPDGVYLVPEGVDTKAQLAARGDMSFVPLDGEVFHFLAVFRPGFEASPLLAALHAFLNESDPADFALAGSARGGAGDL